MAVNISPSPTNLDFTFELLTASDPRPCLLLDRDGIIVSVNVAASRALPKAISGMRLTDLGPESGELEAYLRRCAATRSPVPGLIHLIADDGLFKPFSAHGGLVERGAEGARLIVIRLQQADLGRSVFTGINEKFEALGNELAWRKRSERVAGHLAAIVSSSTDAIYSKDLQNIVKSWNRGAERLFGYTAQEIIGQSILCLIPLEKREEERQLIQRLKAGELVEPIESLRQAKDGTLIETSITSSLIRNSAGQPIGISGIVRDITARKKTERALQTAHDTFRQVVENSPFGVFTVDADFRIAQVSAGAQNAFVNVRPLIGRDLAEALRIVWPEPAATQFIGHFRHTLATGEPYHDPTTVGRRYDTQEVEAYDWKIERMILPDGRPGVVCHYYDLTERQLYEAELRRSEQRFRGTFENASVGIAHIGVDGEWREFNDRLCQILGFSRDDLSKRSFASLHKPDGNDAHDAEVAKLTQGDGESYQYETQLIRQDGSGIWVSINIGVQQNDEGDPDYLIYVLRDISERKAAQEHQRMLMRELSHRSKNQLTVIQAIANQTRRSSASLEEFGERFTQRLHSLAVSLNLLVDGKWNGVDLAELIEKQLAGFMSSDDGGVWCEGPPVSVSDVAAEAIGLALHELSTNCAKYGAWSVPSGSVRITWNIDSGTSDEPRLVLSWVEQNGPPVEEPRHSGFGRFVIERMVEQKLQADVELRYSSTGVTWTLTTALSAVSG